MYKSVITIFFLFLTLTAAAQQGKYNETVDSKTYELYMKSDWSGLRETGMTAIDSGIDFYYLRMRLGISYYQEENYMSSVSHFEKAVSYKPQDTTALEYLYYAYLFSGQEADAKLLAKRFPSGLKKKINYKAPEFFGGIYTEGGYSLNPDFSSNKNKGVKGNQDLSGTQNVFKNETYLNVSLMHSIEERVTVFHGYGNIVVNSLRRFDDAVNAKKEFNISVKQNEYYLNLGFYLGRGFNLTTAFHYLSVKTQDYEPPTPPSNTYTGYTFTTDNSAGNISLSKRVGHTELGAGTVFANMNGGKQNQSTFTFIWYPFGNLNLYTVSNFIFHTNKKNDSSDAVTRFLFDEKLGFKLASKLWMEAVFTTGPIFNYSESNAFIIYNNLDKIKYKAGINLISPISENFELSVRYLLLSQDYDVTTTNSNSVSTTITNNLLIHKIIGGIKWTF